MSFKTPLPSRKIGGFKKAEEAFHVAIMLVGIMVVQKKKYWMQIVSDTEGRPDIKTGCYREPRDARNTWETQFVEVVTFEEHSYEERLLDFLKRTKLTQTTSRDPQMIILCKINRSFQLPSLQMLAADIRRENFPNPVIILGKTSPDQEIYKIAQINPHLDLIREFGLKEELERQKHSGVLNLKRGSRPVFKREPDIKHYPFEKLGIVP